MARGLALACLLGVAAPARGAAMSLEDAQVNIETVIQTYVAARSPDGLWRLKPRGTGRTWELRFESIDKKTVLEVSPDRFQVLAAFIDAPSRARRYAQLDVDLGGSDWKVAGLRWLSRAQRDDFIKRNAERAKGYAASKQAAERAEAERKAALAAKRAAIPAGQPALPEVGLPTLGSEEKKELYSCPARRCAAVYVTPWCPHCRTATAMILQLRKHLDGKGVPLRVVVGKDSEANVLAYAQDFGKETLLDPSGIGMPPGGVPYFCSYEDGGRILRHFSGAPMDGDPAAIAGELGLR